MPARTDNKPYTDGWTDGFLAASFLFHGNYNQYVKMRDQFLALKKTAPPKEPADDQ